MTIANARRFLQTLRWEHRDIPVPTTRQAKKLAKAADNASSFVWLVPDEIDAIKNYEQHTIALLEWHRLLVRIYDESVRLRAIAEGKR